MLYFSERGLFTPRGRVELIREHDIADNLSAFFIFRDRLCYDAVSQRLLFPTNAVSVDGGLVGEGVRFSSDNQYVLLPDYQTLVTPTSGSMAAGFIPSTGNTGERLIFSMRSSNLNNRYYLRYDANAGGYGFAGASQAFTGVSWPVGVYGSSVLSWNESGAKWYLNGNLEHAGSTPATLAPAAASICTLSNNPGFYGARGTVHWAAIWSKPVSQKVARELHRNPWQLLRRSSHFIFTQAAVPSTLTVTPSNITQTGARISVQLGF